MCSYNNLISSIGVVTRNRPDCLQRCVASYAAATRADGRVVRFVITDDSDEQRADQNLSLLRELSATHDVPIWYAGVQEKQQFIAKLVEAGVQADTVLFALNGDDSILKRTGANRNMVYLQTLGEQVLCVDDDTVCRVVQAPESTDAVALRSVDPYELWFFENRQASLAALPEQSTDLLAAHERFLGQRLGDVTPITAYAEHRVLATYSSLMGDCCWSSNARYITTGGATHARLIRSEEAYHRARASREVLLAVTQPTVSVNPVFCMTYSASFDHRQLLPPFMPVGSNQDRLFGKMLKLCYVDGAFAYVPQAILHAPPGERTFQVGYAGQAGLNAIIIALLQNYRFQQDEVLPEQRMVALGSYLCQIARLPLAEFQEMIRSIVHQGMRATIEQLEAWLEERGHTPAFWASDLCQHIERLRRFVDTFEAPIDLLNVAGSRQANLQAQLTIGRFGELLQAWPALVQATQSLAAQGHHLARLL